jgi:hypothetical protein
LFDKTNYAFWSIRMQTLLMALAFDIFKFVVTGYKAPTYPPMDKDRNNVSVNNEKSMNVILCGL